MVRYAARHRSTAWPLALAFAALVVYASLYPFSGWRWPPMRGGLDLLRLPWPPWRNEFDEISNLVGYMPLGALLFGAVVRSGGSLRAALATAVLASAGLSFAVELTQNFLPTRVPSLKDCAFNGAGALAGALSGALLQALGWVDRWHALRERWFARRSAGALVLLVLWPVGLLFPTPVPLGLGQVGGELRALADAALAGTSWAADIAAWLGDADGADVQPALSRGREFLAIALGLLAPCLVAFATTRAGWHRLALLGGATLLAIVVSTFSTALNFGPEHALAWWSPSTWPALAMGVALALTVIGAGPRLAAALGLAALTAWVVLIAHAPADPYYAASLQGWEQGRFIRFHGLAQWIGWLWPYAAMAWLLTRLARRGDD
ncbi:MAG: VanZ family protein [Burkholderiaceae bacterium]|nr:VanZ family protein [Burkholderiaceae bacterium]